MQLGVVSLWSLLEACRAGSDEEQRQSALSAETALAESIDGEAGLSVELQDSILLVDDMPVVSGVDTFAATHGLVAFLRDAGTKRVHFTAGVDRDGLLQWARHIVAQTRPEAWPAGVGIDHCSEVETQEPVTAVARVPVAGAQPDSRLRSVFLQHRLIDGLPSIAGVDPSTAKLVVQEVVDRLLQIEGGLEPLMLLQQDEGLLRRSTAIAVLTVLIARSAGWPTERLVDLGAAGLLHDIGAILDPEEPGPAGFRWLVERGDSDFWLRSALVARRWRDGALASATAAGPLAVVALVRLAVALSEDPAGLDALAASGAVPDELCAVARDVVLSAGD